MSQPLAALILAPLSVRALQLTFRIWRALNLSRGWRVYFGMYGFLAAIIFPIFFALAGMLVIGIAADGIAASVMALAATYQHLVSDRMLDIYFDRTQSTSSAPPVRRGRITPFVSRRTDPAGRILQGRMFRAFLVQVVITGILLWALSLPVAFAAAIGVPVVAISWFLWLSLFREPK